MRSTAKYIDRVQKLDADVLKAIFTAILPVLITTSPALRRLLDALLNMDQPEPPVAGG
jgi:hypothetical protein